jgi:hypothetical protein
VTFWAVVVYLTPWNFFLPTAADTSWSLKLYWWPVRSLQSRSYLPANIVPIRYDSMMIWYGLKVVFSCATNPCRIAHLLSRHAGTTSKILVEQ